jgi:predicted neutral ceramidase superfamily lipid hydrolase
MAEETAKERVDRELIELLNELRVALPGVQVLFAFLLIVPFTDHFDTLSDTDRNVYFTAFIAAALSSVFLIAPSAHHRMRFRVDVKETLVKAATVYTVIGLVMLAIAVSAVLFLITDVVYQSDLAGVLAAGFGLAVTAFWFVVPFVYGRSS